MERGIIKFINKDFAVPNCAVVIPDEEIST